MTVADVEVFLDTGGSDDTPANEDDTSSLGPPNIRYKRADNSVIDSDNPNTIPPGGTTLSRWKSTYLKVVNIQDATEITSVRSYSDGSGFGTGISVQVADQTPIKNSGSNSGYGVSDTDDQTMIIGHPDVTSETNWFTFISTNAKTVSISESNSKMEATGDTSNYLITQMIVANTAQPGNLADETYTWLYDEI